MQLKARSVLLVLLGTSGAAGVLAACTEPKSEPTPARPTASAAPTPVSSVTTSAATSPKDAGNTVGTKDAGAVPYDGPMIGGLYGQTPIMSEMDWPTKEEDRKKGDKDRGSVRIGYIRQGAKVPVIAEPHPKSNCKEGWYELVQGGFVCGKYASLDMNHPKIRLAPHLPDMVSSLPFQYGYNIQHGTPLYRSIPSREERLKLEPWLAQKKAKPKPREDDSTASYGDEEMDAGAALTLTRATMTASTTDPFGLASDDAGTPWYLRDYDGGKPVITLDELKGEGPVSRRMVKGFFVALDKEMASNGFKWWKTTQNLIAPYDRIVVHSTASKFHGIWLNDDSPAAQPSPNANADGGVAPAAQATAERKPTPDLCKPGSKAQVGIITHYKAHKYIVAVSRKAVTTGDSIGRHAIVKLTGDTVSINGTEFDETDEGYWIKSIEATKTRPGDAPKDLQPGEKWIDVNVKTETLVMFEGDKPVYVTAVSTGKENREDKEKDHHTPPGSFRIREKHIAATMDGDGASDGPYSIEEVPWIMYYSGSYALHGAFWHNNFGRQQSHGCVNLAPADGKAIFGWTEPHLPDGWHGVMSTPEKPGTRIVVHE